MAGGSLSQWLAGYRPLSDNIGAPDGKGEFLLAGLSDVTKGEKGIVSLNLPRTSSGGAYRS